MNEKYKKMLQEAMKNKSFNLKEFLTRSEGPELFTTVLNDRLFGAQPSLTNGFLSIYDTVPMDAGRTVRFPSLRGINADFVPENGEFQRSDWELTATEVEPVKFGILLGLTREMIEHSQLSIIGRQMDMCRSAHEELLRREMAKCLSFFSTGASKTTGAIGLTNHGAFYPSPAGGYTNFISGTAMSYEQRISEAFVTLMSQRVTITAKGIDLPFPVMPDTIICHPTHKTQIRKILNAGITVVAAGDKGTTNVAGNNILNGELPNQIFDPEIPSGQILIGRSKLGTVLVRQSNLQLDEFNNLYFDATDVRSKEEFLPAVVEDRYWVDIQISG